MSKQDEQKETRSDNYGPLRFYLLVGGTRLIGAVQQEEETHVFLTGVVEVRADAMFFQDPVGQTVPGLMTQFDPLPVKEPFLLWREVIGGEQEPHERMIESYHTFMAKTRSGIVVAGPDPTDQQKKRHQSN